MARHQFGPLVEGDALGMQPGGQRLADPAHRDGVAISLDGHQTLPADHDAVEDPVVMRRRWQRLETRALLGQQRRRQLLGRVARTLFIHPPHPGCAFLRQIGVVIEGPPSEKVPFDELDEILDSALLICCRWRTEHGMEAKLHRQLLVGRMQDRLVLRIPPQGDRLRIVARHHPWHPTQINQGGNQAAQQRLTLHVLSEAHPHPAAVFEARREKVARLSHQRRLAKLHLPLLAPVDL